MNEFQTFECITHRISFGENKITPNDIFDHTGIENEIQLRVKDMLRSLRKYEARSYIIQWNDSNLTPYGLEIEPGVMIGNFDNSTVYDFDGNKIGTGLRLIYDGGDDERGQCILVSLFEE